MGSDPEVDPEVARGQWGLDDGVRPQSGGTGGRGILVSGMELGMMGKRGEVGSINVRASE